MKSLFLLVILALSGCATCERHPVACKIAVGVAVVAVTGEAYALAVKHASSNSQAYYHSTNPPPTTPAPGCVGYGCTT